jgi:hypothetical protein
MEGSMVFCQKNILGHSMMFHGDYIKRCLLTIMVSQILHLKQLMSEKKNIVTAANGLFSTITQKGLVALDPGACIIKLITSAIYSFCNKLESLFLESLSSLV